MTVKVVVVAEGPGDAEVCRVLAERLMAERGPTWVGDHVQQHGWASIVDWSGLEGGEYTRWTDLKQLAKRHRVATLTKLGGGVAAALARRAAVVANRVAPDAVLVAHHDAGDFATGPDGYRAACHDEAAVAALPAPETEAWLLAGFEAGPRHEQDLLAEECSRLGFDPTTQGASLSARDTHQRSAKGCLKRLTGGDKQRQRACLDAPLDQLLAHACDTGLAEYMEDVEAILAPAILGQPLRP